MDKDKTVNKFDKNSKEKAHQLIDELSKFCSSNGWDFYGAIFMGPNDWFDSCTDSENGFMRQNTMLSCTSPGLQTILGLPWVEPSDIAEASASNE